MARKSRKNKEEIEIRERVPELQNEKKIKVGGYVRLSSDKNDSDSIDTQILMIKQFVNDHPEMEIEDFYVDEGFTGTNFARPDFARMIGDIKSGCIDCIIVKDFSRFGRNYIEAGYYLETVLPHLGVRFISINDRFDSNREEDRNGISVPIKNLINSMYATDISKKLVKSVELHHQIGDAKYRTSIYGYFLNREANQLEIDKTASKYVKLIFYWYAKGYSTNEIALKLNAAEVLIPSKYKEQYSKRKSSSKINKWTSTTIVGILKNPVYIGAKVNGKCKTRLTENLDHKVMPKDDWYIHENSHEAIVSRDLFDIVNEKLDNHLDKYREYCSDAKLLNGIYKNLFSRKVVCGNCGKTMTYVRKNKGSAKYGFQEAYYTCSRNKDDTCRQIVYEDYLKTVVLDQIKELFKYLCGQKSVIASLRDGTNDKSVLLSYEKVLINQKKKEADYDNLLVNLYKDLADEIIDANEYKELSEKYQSERTKVQERIKRTNESIYKMRKWIDAFEDLGIQLADYFNDDVNSEVIISELVDKVIISDKGEIELCLKCSDVIERFNSLLEDENEANSNILKVVFG